MPQRSLFLLGGAIALGLLAVLVMRFYIVGSAPSTTPAVAGGPASVQIVVAVQPLGFGSRIDRATLKLAAWPANAVPPGSFTSLAAVDTRRVVVAPVAAGEPLLAGKLSGAEGRPSISYRIGEDMRAVAVRVSDVAGVGGFILPGERVDVLFTSVPDPMTQTKPFNDLLVQDVRVIAINQDANEAKDKPEVAQSVTLEVTPAQAQKLALAQAQSVGTISLMLRNPVSKSRETLRTVRLTDLHDGGRAAPPPVRRAVAYRPRPAARRAPAAPATVEIAVVRGTAATPYQVGRIN